MDDNNATFEKRYTTQGVFDEITRAVNESFQLGEGDMAMPPPDPEQVVALVIGSLGEFGVLQGSHFSLVKYAREVLKA